MALLNDLLIPGIATGSLYAMVAMGFCLLERSSRILNFAHGDVIMWAALAPIVAGTLWGFPAWLALLSGLCAALIFGLLIERVAMRPFLGQSNNFTWILTTLGASAILQQLAAEPFNGQDKAFPYRFSLAPISDSFDISVQSLIVIAGAAGCALVLYLMSERSSIGRRLTAVGSDPQGALVLGISPGRMSQVAMVFAVLTACVAGMTVAPLLLVSPHFGFSLTFTGFVAAAIGGLGSLKGAVVGGIAVGFIIQFTTLYVGSDWTNTMLFGALLALYLVRPWGLFGHRPARAV